MTKQEIIALIRQEIFKDSNKSRFIGVQSIQDHIHNGVDAPKINQDNLENGTATNSVIVMNENETFQLRNVKGISRLTFHGFAANNADGSAATQRVLINGTVVFGVCSRFTGAGNEIRPDGSSNETPFTQGCSYMYTLNQVDTIRVGATSDAFAVGAVSVTDPEAKAYVVGVSIDSITIKVELKPNWQITGSFILN